MFSKKKWLYVLNALLLLALVLSFSMRGDSPCGDASNVKDANTLEAEALQKEITRIFPAGGPEKRLMDYLNAQGFSLTQAGDSRRTFYTEEPLQRPQNCEPKIFDRQKSQSPYIWELTVFYCTDENQNIRWIESRFVHTDYSERI